MERFGHLPERFHEDTYIGFIGCMAMHPQPALLAMAT
jgi:hypothetical protein